MEEAPGGDPLSSKFSSATRQPLVPGKKKPGILLPSFHLLSSSSVAAGPPHPRGGAYFILSTKSLTRMSDLLLEWRTLRYITAKTSNYGVALETVT